MITTTFKEFNISCQNHDKCLGDLLFIHGFCVDHSYFTAAKELSKYFNIYMIDLPGHGANTEGATQDDMHLQKLADYIVSYVEYKKLNNFYLMGHSMGGGLVSMVENQISDKIRKLILLCPFNFGGAFAGFKSFYIFYPHNMEEKNNLLQILYAPDNYAKFSKDPHWTKMNEEQLKFQIENWDNMHILFKRMSNSLMKIRKIQKQIKVPTLLMVGKFDGCIPWKHTLNGFKRYFKHKSLKTVVFEKSGHLIFEEEPALFIKEILDFVKN